MSDQQKLVILKFKYIQPQQYLSWLKKANDPEWDEEKFGCSSRSKSERAAASMALELHDTLERIARAEGRVRELETENARLIDLVRYSRHYLHDEKLLNDEEYAALVVDADNGQRVARLEGYDRIRRENERLKGTNKDFLEALEWYANGPKVRGELHIVTTHDGLFLSDFSDWGDKAREVIAAHAKEPAQ